MMEIIKSIVAIFLVGILMPMATMAGISITRIEPTPLFPKEKDGQPLKQISRLYIENTSEAKACKVRVSIEGEEAYVEDIGIVASGESVYDIHILDISQPKKLKIEILNELNNKEAETMLTWQPSKKWNIYCIVYCHQDLGFGDYPHRLRTTIRHANINLPLQFCRETDDWELDEQYRFEIETAEAIPGFIGFFGKHAALDLGQRIREGRIQIGGMHNTANTEQYSHELMARQFYLAGRHTPDLLQTTAGLTVQQTDVIGVTLPLATYAKEAGFNYFFHGINRLAMPDKKGNTYMSGALDLDSELGKSVYFPAQLPAFYWEGPDGQRLLSRATTYERHGLLWDPYNRHPSVEQDEKRIEMLIKSHEKINWPFDCFLSQDGTDFLPAKRMISDRAHNWNSRYAYPHLKTTTMDAYFEEIDNEIEVKNLKINTINTDGNNQWTDQDAADARTFGKARILGEAIPTTEKLATLAQVFAGGSYSWTEMYQAYHRLLQYHEHSNGKAFVGSSEEELRWYETEQAELREMAIEADEFQKCIREKAQVQLANSITRKSDKNLIVFNPLPYSRTDVVRCEETVIPAGISIIDSETGEVVEHQQLPDSTVIFIASNIPATGYKTYRFENAPKKQPTVDTRGSKLENDFYRMEVNTGNGAIVSLFDKALNVELVEQGAPYHFNEYLYQRFEGTIEDSLYQYNDTPTYRMDKADVFVQPGQVADVVTIKGKAEGATEIQQTVILYHALKRIDFGMFVNKTFSQIKKEGVYVSLPFDVPDFKLRHELPGAVIEPFKQQIDGSCTAHHAIRSFTDISNENYGVTVSPIESSLVCYGAPRPSPMFIPGYEYKFDRSQEYPETSRLYLYLMNNMFDVNIPVDQQGPVDFHWSIRSHSGDWQTGEADRFGRQVLQPLLCWRADGKNKGSLPSTAKFLSIDMPNVSCSTIKTAEANGQGIILRFNETAGIETTAKISLPLIGKISSVAETNLVEEDREIINLNDDNTFTFKINPFGVKTIRVIKGPTTPVSYPYDLEATATSDMQVDLKWKCSDKDIKVSHFNIYRDDKEKCEMNLLNFIGQTSSASFIDQPKLNYGGWIRNTLEAGKTYYYRIVTVDNYNNESKASDIVEVTTLDQSQKNLAPIKIEALRAILVSRITDYNFVNLLFRTSCESDIEYYEVHRSLSRGFSPSEETLIGKLDNNEMIKGSEEYGHTPEDYPVKEFDHAMFADMDVDSGKTYYYKVCAVDVAGQKGEFSEEVFIKIKN